VKYSRHDLVLAPLAISIEILLDLVWNRTS
jgi:hypothetical protein